MSRSPLFIIATVLIGIASPAVSSAKDFVRLRDGRLLEGAVIRQDTSVVVMTSWEDRHLLQPPLQVFTHDEVQSIWFVNPTKGEGTVLKYRPHIGGFEIGGSMLFQTWAESELVRRHLFMMEFQGGYTITAALGLDLAAAFTIPMGGGTDSTWHGYDPAYHVAMSVVVHPIVWNGLVPYALAGGGAAIGTPVNHVILVSSKDVRSLVNFGLGVKWGINHIGVRMEWRHHFYTWTPDAVDESGVRVSEQTADASMIRVGLFYFR